MGAASGSRLTETGLSVGTPNYMSPEQATGGEHVGPPTDTYALGCVLYKMLIGEPSYTGSTAQAILGKIIAGSPDAVAQQRGSVPAKTSRVALKLLDTGERQELMIGSNPRYVSTGHLVFARGNSLWAVRFDLDRLETVGEPSSVVEDLSRAPVANGSGAQFAFSASSRS